MSKLYIKNRYGICPNHILSDENLSFKAKGIFTYIQSKPDKWQFSINKIAKQTKDGKDAIRSGIQELEKYGYLLRKSTKNAQGRWNGYDYYLSDNPVRENPLTVDSIMEKGGSYSNKDNSNKDNSKKDILFGNDAFPSNGKKINELFGLFKKINPSLNFANKTERDSLDWLLKKCGDQTAERVINQALSVQGNIYAPVITTPYQLKNKLSRLIIYLKRKVQEELSESIL